MTHRDRSDHWKVYRGSGRPAIAEPKASLQEQASAPLVLAENVLRDLRAAEKEMIKLINELRYGGR
jgi:hypothetical protein